MLSGNSTTFLLTPLLFTSLLSVPVLAETESSLFFIGVKGGYQWASDGAYNHSAPSGSIGGLYSGLQLSPALRWDLGYQYHDDLNAADSSVNIKVWLIESALRYDWYLQDKLSLYGRFGAAYWGMEKKLLSSDKLNVTGFSPLGEVGVSYALTPSLGLSAGYQYIDGLGKSNVGKYDSYAALMSLTYTFGRATQLAPVEAVPVVGSVSVSRGEILESELLPQTWLFSPKTAGEFLRFDSIELSREISSFQF
ncbi:outer membrane beta-barrel protein [Vibrio crassostreae]|uniref:outer membrane beta-barrel protein n=1 Tax=Vibrio crassostreae TaxID=246167 RepID=UPI0031F5511C